MTTIINEVLSTLIIAFNIFLWKKIVMEIAKIDI